MSVEKPRILQDSRDMFLTMGALLVVVAFSVGLTGMCSYNPGRPDSGPVQEVDVDTVLSIDARGLPFPVRNPSGDLPQDWTSNSVRRTVVGQHQATVAGWVIDGQAYVQLTQTDAPADAVSRGVDGEARTADGSVDVDGVPWQVWVGEGDIRALWVADLGDVRLLIDGLANQDAYRQLARAAQLSEPLPAQAG